MNKRQIVLLEKAFAAEIEHAIEKKGSGLLHKKSKIADQLVTDGYLQWVSFTLPGRFPVTVSGYALTEFGRITYCFSCEEDDA